jgi:DNA-binding MarR family transcriptional regulator
MAAPTCSNVVPLIDTLVRLHQAELHCIEQEFGLTPLEARLLRALNPTHPQAMARLSEAIACNPANTTAVVDRLEDRGLIERQSDPDDRRVKTIAITPEGERLRNRLCTRASTPPPWLAGLTATEQDDLERVLQRIDELATSAKCPPNGAT